MKKLNSFKDDEASISTPFAQNNLKERSELVHEIISRKPNFIEKWALSIFGGILLMLLASLQFVKYPDTIETTAILTSENAPKEIIARRDGRIIKFIVRHNDSVNKNEILGWIESTANHNEVLKLSKQLDTSLARLQSGLPEKDCVSFKTTQFNFGELQPAYQQFNIALNTFKDYLVNGFYYRRRAMLEKDIQSLKNGLQTLRQQQTLIEQDIDLARQSYEMNKSLHEQKVLSNEEFREEKRKFINKQLELPQTEALLLSNETAMRTKLNEIEQLDHDIREQKGIFQQALQSLKSVVDEWKNEYIIISPVKGRLTLVMPLQENQLLGKGKIIGYVNPEDSRVFMQTNLPQNNFGKISEGLNVQLRFEAYPYQEAGIVEGTLQHISNIPTDSGFLATIALKKGLITNNNKLIFGKSGLKAQAIIITKNMTLLERLRNSLTKSISVSPTQPH